jgi:hypothetical protein
MSIKIIIAADNARVAMAPKAAGDTSFRETVPASVLGSREGALHFGQ